MHGQFMIMCALYPCQVNAEKRYARGHKENNKHVIAFYTNQPALRSQTFLLLTIDVLHKYGGRHRNEGH